MSIPRTHENYRGPPLLFETVVIGGGLDGEVKKYATWEEAEKGRGDCWAFPPRTFLSALT